MNESTMDVPVASGAPNGELLRFHALAGTTVREHPELGLIAALRVSTFAGIDVQVSLVTTDLMAPLLAWADVLDGVRVRVEVAGVLDGVATRAWVLVADQEVVAQLREELGEADELPVDALRRVRIGGAE